MVARFGVLLLLTLAACIDPNFNDEQEFAKGDPLTSPANPSLTSAQILAFLRNSTLVHEDDEWRWNVYLREDGSMVGIAELIETPGTTNSANGTWEVLADDKICRQWDKDWGGGDFGCATVQREGEDYIFTPVDAGEGAPNTLRRTRLAGNPLSL